MSAMINQKPHLKYFVVVITNLNFNEKSPSILYIDTKSTLLRSGHSFKQQNGESNFRKSFSRL